MLGFTYPLKILSQIIFVNNIRAKFSSLIHFTYKLTYFVGHALQTRGISWQVPTGRRDGRISLASDTANLPGFTESVEAQKQKFLDKGLNTQDLVTLVGKHQIKLTHLYNDYQVRAPITYKVWI